MWRCGADVAGEDLVIVPVSRCFAGESLNDKEGYPFWDLQDSRDRGAPADP